MTLAFVFLGGERHLEPGGREEPGVVDEPLEQVADGMTDHVRISPGRGVVRGGF